MAQSDRSSDPRRRPAGVPRKSGSSPPSGSPARQPRGPAKPRPPARSANGRPAGAGPTRPTARPVAGATPRRPGQPTKAARPARAAKAKKPAKAEKPARSTDASPSGSVGAQLRAAWDWLLDDPSKKKRSEPTEREKAIAAVEARDEAERKRFLAEKLHLESRRADGQEPAEAAPAEPTPARRPKAGPRPSGAKGRATNKDANARNAVLDWAPVVFLLTKVLGQRKTAASTGQTVYAPPPQTDWRWKLHQFLHSQSRIFVGARTALIVCLLVSVVWTSVFATTGYDLTDVSQGADPDDPRSQYPLPFFIVESGSMMHRDASFGRLGTVDPGDMIVLEKVDGRKDIETFYGAGERRVGGAKGDVIMFLPVTAGDEGESQPIIHRAMAYLERKSVTIANPQAAQPNQPSTLSVVRYTVEEFGIYESQSVSIPELGLRNYRPPFSGFITRGDNTHTNNWADQAVGIAAAPIPEDRILGRLKAEVPYIGLTKIALSGQDPSLIVPDEQWCSFLAGKAACDTWVVFLALVAVFVGVPLAWALLVFGRRAYHRQLDRMIVRARQAEEDRQAADARDAWDQGPNLPVHDAVDLLSGRVVVEGVRTGPRPTSWNELTGPARVRIDEDDTA